MTGQLFVGPKDRLQGQKQWLLLSILNSHVRFEMGIFVQ
jgi:hypothetical protein